MYVHIFIVWCRNIIIHVRCYYCMILYTYIYDDLLDHLIYLIYPSELVGVLCRGCPSPATGQGRVLGSKFGSINCLQETHWRYWPLMSRRVAVPIFWFNQFNPWWRKSRCLGDIYAFYYHTRCEVCPTMDWAQLKRLSTSRGYYGADYQGVTTSSWIEMI